MKSIHEVKWFFYKSIHEIHVGEMVDRMWKMCISYLERYEVYFMGVVKLMSFFYPLGPKGKIGEIHSFV